MKEMASLWSYQQSINELKLKIHQTALELEAVKAIANEEMDRNTESEKQLLQLLKLICHERDETRDQIQKLLIKITPSINHTMISDFFMIDQVHQRHQNSLMKPAKENSSIAESNSLSDAYNHSTSPVDSLFDPVNSPEFSNMSTNTSFVQDYHHEVMLSDGFHAMGSVPKIDHATLMIESMIKGKALPQKGNLLQAVMEAGPLLQTMLVTHPIPSCQNMSRMQSFRMLPVSCGSFPQMTAGGGGGREGSFLSFNDANMSNYQGAGRSRANNFGFGEKRQRFH